MKSNPVLFEAFGRFLQEGDLNAFLAVRDVLMSLPSYNPRSPELQQFDNLLTAEDWTAMIELADSVIDNWMLTPYLHEVLALAHQKLGNESHSQLEQHLFSLCVKGILQTGEGTREIPYLIVRTDDAYGVLHYLDVNWTNERRVKRGDLKCLVLVGEDGRDYWFALADTNQKHFTN